MQNLSCRTNVQYWQRDWELKRRKLNLPYLISSACPSKMQKSMIHLLSVVRENLHKKVHKNQAAIDFRLERNK